MAECHCRDVGEYIRLLAQSRDLRARCEALMTVSISRFFRDRTLWETLGEHVLPDLARRHSDQLALWFAGCACGEEVYSFKILWEEIRPRLHPLPVIQVLATDMNPAFLARAMDGVYSASSLREVPEPMRQRYFFRKENRSFVVKPFLKEGISWQEANFISRIPGESFHIVFLRNNLLTYYEEEVRRSVFPKVVERVVAGGYLVIGSHERVPSGTENLRQLEEHPCIFQINRLAAGAPGLDKKP